MSLGVEAKPSSWDSDLFGYRVGLLDVQDIPSIEAIAEANRTRFDVVFVKSRSWVEPCSGVVAVDHLYDMEIRLDQGEEYHSARPVTLFSPRSKHFELARTAFHDSRFFRDPKLISRTSELYVRWISNRQVWTLDKAPDDGFLLTEVDEDGAGRIALVAVNEQCRRKGTGRLLMISAVAKSKLEIWRVKVSVRNYRAVRCYETLGFLVKSVETAFHVWTNEREGF